MLGHFLEGLSWTPRGLLTTSIQENGYPFYLILTVVPFSKNCCELEKMRWRGTEVSVLQVALVLALTCEWVVQGQPLSVAFYNTTCPNVDAIVTSVVTRLASSSNVVAPSTLRLFTHDCFVQVRKSWSVSPEFFTIFEVV